MSDDFTTDNLILKVRECEFWVHWATTRGSYAMSYPTEAGARRHFDALNESVSITHVSIVYRGETLAQFDYDPYEWHDVRKAVGR